MIKDGLKLTIIEQKRALRFLAKTTLQGLREQRRAVAAKSLVETLIPRLSSFALVLSFASYKGEIDLCSLNQQLLAGQQLCLPCLSKTLFRIHTLEGLHPNPLKPNPSLYEKIALESIDCILVPALLFDRKGFRLGKGGGFYDYLLEHRMPKTLSLGIGFKEQLVDELLPRELHDQPVDQLFLF